MDYVGESFNLSIITNIDLTSKLFEKIAKVCEVIKVVFDQKGNILEGIKAKINVAPNLVNFITFTAKPSDAEGTMT